MTRLVWVWVATLVACTDATTIVDQTITAIEVSVQLDPGLGIDQLQVSSTAGDVSPFAPGSVPAEPRALASGESFVVLVPDALDGQELAIRVDGLATGAVVASGLAPAVVRVNQLTHIEVALGSPAICGDAIVRDGIETCDDGNPAGTDGCSDGCVVETGWVCVDLPSRCELDVFSVDAAVATGNRQITVTFSAPPSVVEALTLANYAVANLSLTGVPVLSANTVTLETSPQLMTSYLMTVSGVSRAADGKSLSQATASFAGVPLTAPTVTAVEVTATVPNNANIPYNTGTTTVVIRGTQFTTVMCPSGVRLDDRDGANILVGTQATSCSVDSDSQITATFPVGIRTNGATGWNVLVANQVGANTAGNQRFVARGGLLLSEVYTGRQGPAANAEHEYVELYNPTDQPIDASQLGVSLHVRDAAGLDTRKDLTFTNPVIPPHGFMLLVSTATDAADAWFVPRDAVFAAGLVANGGVYLSLSATAQARVIDKLGWGAQAPSGREGTAVANIGVGQSVERKPASGTGHATDVDDNLTDFTMASPAITPRGTASAPQP